MRSIGFLLFSTKVSVKLMLVQHLEMIVLRSSKDTITTCLVFPKTQATICFKLLRARKTFLRFGSHTVRTKVPGLLCFTLFFLHIFSSYYYSTSILYYLVHLISLDITASFSHMPQFFILFIYIFLAHYKCTHIIYAVSKLPDCGNYQLEIDRKPERLATGFACEC